MHAVILALLFFMSGFFMKVSDDLYDVKHEVISASVFSIICAVTCALATVSDTGAAYIFIAILIGNLIAFKVDGLHHVLCLILFVIICLGFGIPQINLFILLICIVAAILDEIGHESIPDLTDNRFFNLFFEYRFVMKIIILVLAVGGVFDIWVFVYFILFEIAYVLAGILYKKLS